MVPAPLSSVSCKSASNWKVENGGARRRREGKGGRRERRRRDITRLPLPFNFNSQFNFTPSRFNFANVIYLQSSRSYSIFPHATLCTLPSPSPFPLPPSPFPQHFPTTKLSTRSYGSPLPLSISSSYASIIIPTPNSKKVKVMYHHVSSSMSS